MPNNSLHYSTFSQIKFGLWGVAAMLLLTACIQAAPPPPTAVAVGPTTLITPTPLASASPTATTLPTSTATASPTPTPHPMSIEAMRQREYPGSDLSLERELAPGANYRRYYASYLSDGLKIYGLLTIPNGERPATGWPVIIFNHGYIPPGQYRTTERYVAYVDRLALSGYIVFRSDYRGHDQSEGEATGAYGDPGYVIDVLNATASLKRFPGADPKRIGMWGHSMGGYITLRSMVIDPDIKAGVIWAGVVAPYPDLFARGNTRPTPTSNATPFAGGRGWRRTWVEQFGSPEENPAFWNGISANSYLADLAGPLQLHHGTADEEVPLAASQLLYKEMTDAGLPVELYTDEGDNHNLSNYFTLAMNRTIEFFDLHVK